MKRCRVGYAMHLGGRANQEDCLFVHGEVLQEVDSPALRRREIEGSPLLLAVCDGMGGHAQGERASRMVAERLRDALDDVPATPEAVVALLGRIQELLVEELACSCGTTIAGVALGEGGTLVFSAGDSRVYRLRDAAIERLTRDHSYVQGCVDRGEISAQEAPMHPYRNVIEFGLGDVFASTWELREQEVFTAEFPRSPGECFLICSDGLHDALRDDEIRDALGPSPFDGLALLREQLPGSVRDNTSYILVEDRE